ncbi:MAG TPA: AAA family ATPase [Leptospiraceae bacterium]|nr:AAA family ATPase [Leptospiraceae bacterium]HMY67484.1 AAA family ATPase [Leptospiraceae bacterium]HMZ57140.1 AAA family ATPase [Leptospiraceae bacterium]HNF14131.1 AAA family ATPase [Leptospiraceae bacterium]HNF23091.1 AAA family ATPase [Leptospiraceae bacterium]
MGSRIAGKILEKSRKSILLLGPRQVGKSTLLKGLNPDIIINLASESEYLRYLSDPGLLVSVLKGGFYKTVLIDEIQRIPSLLNTIQMIIDDWDRAPKFYLSGSSARKLKKGNANLLPGRIHQYSLSGFSGSDLEYRLDLEKAIRFGFLPEPYLEGEENVCRKILRDYAAGYLKEEIQAEALSRNIQGFARFLQTVGGVSGSILDFSKIASKAKVSRSSAVRFLEILEDTLIAERIENFPETDADTVRHPKLYFFDIGVLNGLLGNFEPSADRIGKSFEHLVYSQIRNSAFAKDEQIELFYFRTRNGLEVDFILKLQGKVYAIEANAGDVHASDLRSLIRFREYCPKLHQCIAVSLKEDKIRNTDNIMICGVSEMLQLLGL